MENSKTDNRDTKMMDGLVDDMDFPDLTTILLSITVCLCLISLLYGWNKNVYKNFPPGPKPWPLIGNLHLMDAKRPYLTFIELSKKYGSIFSVQMGSKKMVVLCGYETVKDALVNYADEFSQRPTIPIVQDTSKGHGIVFANGENWRVMRRFTLSTLRDYGMGKKTIEDKINEETNSLLQKFESFKGKPFENTMILNAAVANIIVSIIFGRRFNYEDQQFLRLMGIIKENLRLMSSRIIMLYNAFPSVVRWLPGNHKKVHENIAEFQRFVKETYTKYKEELDVNDQRNRIDSFLVKQQEENPTGLYFHDSNLTVLVSNLFAAGMETTSTTLRWGLLLMMKYPEIQKNVQNEIEKVIGSAQPQTEHRKNMPYTDAVVYEIQRFANIVPANVPRETAQDVWFKGYFIPKGTYIVPMLASVLKDKNYFQKPDEFYPQHFLDSEGHFVKNDAFMPFSAGKRICAGETLAKMELFLFFTRLLQKFTFQHPPGAPEIDLTSAIGFTTSPMMHEMCALPRN